MDRTNNNMISETAATLHYSSAEHHTDENDDDNEDDNDDLDGIIMMGDDPNMLLLSPPLQTTYNHTAPTTGSTREAATSPNYLLEAELHSSTLPDHHHHQDQEDQHDDSDHWRLSNAVHMELQENAKLPTFLWNINRTGSSTTNKFDVSQFFTTATTGTTGTNDPRTSMMMMMNNKSRSNTMDCDDLSFTGGGDATSVNLEEYLDIGDTTVPSSTTGTTGTQQHQQLNLTEIFLTSEMGQRHSNFPTHKSSRFDVNVLPTTTTIATPNVDIHNHNNNTLDVDIDPTPLSEIKRKLDARTGTSSDTNLESGHARQQSSNNATVPPTITTVPYWSRREQLPIPSPVPPPEDVKTVDHDIHHNTLIPQDTGITNATNAMIQLPESFESTVPVPASVSVPPAAGTYQTKLIGSWKTQEPQHSSIHSVSRPAVQVASQKRTQYGFGRKHVVPSVPATTTKKTASTKLKSSSPMNQKKTIKNYSRSNSQRSQSTTTATTNSAVPVHDIVRAPSLTSQDDDDSESGGGGGAGGNGSILAGNVAYERKKERAKTARIRLNESIDRLQIALNMAGTQSNQRLAMFQEQTIPYRIISDCIKCSEDAKKWDRPSFVGSAATMIQGLNAQCEALVRALHDERHARAEQTVITTTHTAAGSTIPTASTIVTTNNNTASYTTEASAISNVEGDSSSMSKGLKHGHSHDNFSNASPMGVQNNCETPTKRLKLDNILANCDSMHDRSIRETNAMMDESTCTRLSSALFADKSILDRIASFLEPLSLLRCTRACRDWKNGGVFVNDALWQRLAVDRFGFYNVRQWLAKVEDFAHKDVHSSTNLYKTMDATNIMPHCRLDGMLLLGESRLLGKVSAWTYLVERSNGETMRSVTRHSSMPGTGVYTSLPIVQLRTIIQNTGIHDDAVVIREQTVTVDASTRRRGDEMVEIDWDDRFKKRILNLDGTPYIAKVSICHTSQSIYRELCRLRLYEAVVLETNIHARGCATTSKFVQKSNFTKLLVQIRDGTTVPLVIPFPRDATHLLP